MLNAKLQPLLNHILKVNCNDTHYHTSNITYLRIHLEKFFQMMHFNMYKRMESNLISKTDYDFYTYTLKVHLNYITNITTNHGIQFYTNLAVDIQYQCGLPMIEYLSRCFDILIGINCVVQPTDIPELVQLRLV